MNRKFYRLGDFPSSAALALSRYSFILEICKDKRKRKSGRVSEEFELNGNREIEVQVYLPLAYKPKASSEYKLTSSDRCCKI